MTQSQLVLIGIIGEILIVSFVIGFAFWDTRRPAKRSH